MAVSSLPLSSLFCLIIPNASGSVKLMHPFLRLIVPKDLLSYEHHEALWYLSSFFLSFVANLTIG